MSLLDGELPDAERRVLEVHLHECPECHTEYSRFEKLALLTGKVSLPSPGGAVWQNYYRGVCGKMERRARWAYWLTGGAVLVCAANLLFFSAPASALTIGVGAVALIAGVGMLWMTYYCNCKP
jgi:anti-sigma factor RsiW